MDGLREYIPSEVRQREGGEISHDFPYMWDLTRNDTDELTYKTEALNKDTCLPLLGFRWLPAIPAFPDSIPISASIFT